VEPLPIFTATDKPAEMVARAGAWLAGQLGWRWHARGREARTRQANLDVSLRFGGTQWNRRGAGTWMSVGVQVTDPSLLTWQQHNAHLAHRRDGLVFASPLANLTARSTTELFGRLRAEDRTVLSLEELVAILRADVVPHLETFASPANVASQLPDSWLVAPTELAEWAVARGDLDAAKTIVTRWLTRHPQAVAAIQDGRDEVAAGKLEPNVYGPYEQLGRTIAKLEILTADETLPVQAPKPKRRSFTQKLGGWG
jgi:hypothetical protein